MSIFSRGGKSASQCFKRRGQAIPSPASITCLAICTATGALGRYVVPVAVRRRVTPPWRQAIHQPAGQCPLCIQWFTGKYSSFTSERPSSAVSRCVPDQQALSPARFLVVPFVLRRYKYDIGGSSQFQTTAISQAVQQGITGCGSCGRSSHTR